MSELLTPVDERLIHAGFLRQAHQRPQKVALGYRGLSYSYGELERRSRGLAGLMLARGLNHGDRVAIVADRTPALVWSLLAALRAGVTFAVIDAAYPAERVRTLLELFRPSLILTAGGGDARRVEELHPLQTPVCNASRAPCAGAFDEVAPAPETTAYVLFTSGSTGTPKAVAASHEPLVHFLNWQRETFGLTKDDRFSLLSGLSHDPLLRDVFAPLSLGARLEIPEQALLTTPGAAREWLAASGCSVIHTTPPMGELICAGAGLAALVDLRLIFWGGDVLPGALLERIGEVAPRAESVNFYGATETPQAASFFRCGRQPTHALRTPIGVGIDGFELSVAGDDGAEVPAGEEGEVVVTSRYLSLGYFSDGTVSAEWSKAARGGGARTYRTGDIGCRNPDGAIVLLGRKDDQVKIRGYRVDLAEVVASLRAEQGVEQAAVIPLREGQSLRLAAVVQHAGGVTGLELRRRLAERVPGYLVPDVIRTVAALPLLPNGKLDRTALARLAATPAPEEPTTAPACPVQAALIARWAPLFGRERLSPADSFASLNGDSLNYVHAYLAAQDVIGDPPSGWATMTIAQLAAQAPPAPALRGAPRQRMSWLETPILLRAAAILAVVAIHARILPDDSQVTSALFLVSGFLVGRLQLSHAFAQRRVGPLLRYVAVVAVPTLLYGAAMYLFRLSQGWKPPLALLLMGEDLVEWRGFSGAPWGGHEPELWYLHALIHMAAILALGVMVVRRLRLTLQQFLLAAFGLGCVARFVAAPLLLGDRYLPAAHSFSLLTVAPTTHLATFCLGALFAVSRQRAVGPWVLGLAYATLSGLVFGPAMAVVIVLGLLILDQRRVRAPRNLLPPVYAIANASLFIYLVNHKVLRLLFMLPGGAPPLVQIAATVAVGIGVAAVWEHALVLVRRLWRGAAVAGGLANSRKVDAA